MWLSVADLDVAQGGAGAGRSFQMLTQAINFYIALLTVQSHRRFDSPLSLSSNDFLIVPAPAPRSPQKKSNRAHHD